MGKERVEIVINELLLRWALFACVAIQPLPFQLALSPIQSLTVVLQVGMSW